MMIGCGQNQREPTDKIIREPLKNQTKNRDSPEKMSVAKGLRKSAFKAERPQWFACFSVEGDPIHLAGAPWSGVRQHKALAWKKIPATCFLVTCPDLSAGYQIK